MPVGSSNAEDLASSDEIKVFKDEGEDEKRASADLTDLKSSLITESDQEKSPSQTFSSSKTSNSNSQQTSSNNLQNGQRPESTSSFGGKPFEPTLGGYSPFGYPLHPHSPYHPHNGTTALGQMANKVASMVGASSHHSGSHSLPFMMPPNMETRLPQPPPAHMGIPPVHIETKAVSISAWMDFDISNIARNPLYNLSGHGQYSHSVLSDLTQQFQWPNPAMYQLQSTAFRNPYTSPLSSVSSATFPSFVRNPPIMPHPSFSGHSFTHPSFLPSSTSNNIASDNNNNNHNSSDSSKSNRLNNGKNATSNGNNLKNDIFAYGSTNSRLATNNSSSNNNNNNHHRRSSSGSSSSNSLPIENSFSKIKMENGNDSTTNNDKNNIDQQIVVNGVGSGKLVNKNSSCSKNGPTSQRQQQQEQEQEQEQQEREMNKMHIKKPLNAFMIYMKEMRAKVIAESTLKESAAINQILGKRWHEIGRDEQEKYYDKARKERELHMEMHPGWTAKDNYAINGKRKKKKRERNADGERGALKKCRARYGLDQQNHWCKPCRRKKKCIRYLEAARAAAAAASSNGKCRSENESDNFGSVSSVEAPTPESKSTNESDHDNNTMNHLMSSTSNDLSLSSPSNSEYSHFMSTFNHHFSSSAINSPPNHAHLNLSVSNSSNSGNNNNGSNGHHLPTASPLFYPHHNSSSSPLGSRVSSLLTPHSPLTSNISSSNCYSSSSSLVTPSSNNMSQNQVPPRSSPFSIEQLARPHCPQSRSLPLSATNIMANHNTKTPHTNNVSVAVIAQLPTPPSSTDSTGATPAMLSVA